MGRIINNNINLGGLKLLKKQFENINYDHLLIFGCGSSYHTTMLSKYYFNNSSINKFTTIKSIDASDFTKYDLPKKGNTIAVFCSQSGETYDIIKAINIS